MCVQKAIPSVLLVASLFALSAPAWAQADLDGKSFEELINDAKTAYEGEDFDTAIRYLTAANRLQPNARLLLNIAKSYEKADRCVEALVYFRAFLRDPGAEPALSPQAQEALGKSEECAGWNEAMSGRIFVSANLPGARVIIDGKDHGTVPAEIVGYEDGMHVVQVVLDGYETHEESLHFYQDQDVTVAATLREVVIEEEEPVEPPPVVVEKSSSPVIHYAIAGGVGAVGLGLFTVGLITDLGIPAKYDEPREQPGISQAEFDVLTSQRKSAASRALVFYIVGGVLTAGGVGYAAYTAATSSKSEPAPRLTVLPEFGRDGFGLSLSGKF